MTDWRCAKCRAELEGNPKACPHCGSEAGIPSHRPLVRLPELPRPFPRDAEYYTDEYWLSLPVQYVPIRTLIPSQSGVDLGALARLLNGGEAEGGEIAGRAVCWRNRLYLFDGHHRWVIALARGDEKFPVRTAQILHE